MNWTIAGPLFLTVLFVPPRASIDVTETLASSKYPAYKEYQAAVSRIVPWIPGKAKKAAAGNGKAVKKVGNTPPPKPTRAPRLKQTRPSRSPARRKGFLDLNPPTRVICVAFYLCLLYTSPSPRD